jgi:hypothetical protein
MNSFYKFALSSLALVILLIACSNKRQTIEYVPFDQYKFEQAEIEPGTAVKLLAYSGGKPSELDGIYYSQFIAVNETTGDTIRLLSTLVSVPGDATTSGKVYSPTHMFDGTKQITEAVFYPQDSSHQMPIKMLAVTKSENETSETSKLLEDVMKDKISSKEFVVVNKSLEIFDNKYKTAVAVLHFEQIHW